MFYKLYRRLSPAIKSISRNLGLAGGSCRHYPTCSDYSRQAIKKYGILKGAWLSGKRLLKCHPWSEGGYDPLS